MALRNTSGDCILEFLTEYGLFLAKVATFVVAAIKAMFLMTDQGQLVNVIAIMGLL